MQQTADATKTDGLISIAEAAKKVGVNRSTLTRQVNSGAIRSYEGKVRLSEVYADRAKNIDLSQSRRKPKAAAASKPTAEPKAPGAVATVDATTDATDATQDEPGLDDQGPVLVDGVMLPFHEAQRVKENYLARQRKLDFEVARQSLVDREVAGKRFFDLAREYRDGLLGLPARIATLMAAELGVDERKLTESLNRYVHEYLDQLGGIPDFSSQPDQ